MCRVICSVILACMVLGTLLDVLYVQMPKWKEETTIATTDITTNGHSVEVVVDESMPLVAKKTATKTSGAPSVPEIGETITLLRKMPPRPESPKSVRRYRFRKMPPRPASQKSVRW